MNKKAHRGAPRSSAKVSAIIMTTKHHAEESWGPILTVRLETDLAERLREFCYRRRLKKQPVMRLAVQRFIRSVSSATKTKQAATLERLRVAPAVPLAAKEKLVLDRAEFEALRHFVFEHNAYKQHVVRIALIDYLDAEPRKH